MNAVPRLPHLSDGPAVVAFFLLFLIGCTGESGTQEYALQVTPLPPERGEEISIRYDTHNSNAKFKDGHELYATINIKHRYGVDSYRILLAVTDGIHRGTFLVPMDACYLDIAVAPHEQVMFTETFGSVVFENGVAVEHALPPLIASARSYEEARTVSSLTTVRISALIVAACMFRLFANIGFTVYRSFFPHSDCRSCHPLGQLATEDIAG